MVEKDERKGAANGQGQVSYGQGAMAATEDGTRWLHTDRGGMPASLSAHMTPSANLPSLHQAQQPAAGCSVNSDGAKGGSEGRKPRKAAKPRMRWTEEEHRKFLEALQLHGREWRKIEAYVGSRSAAQIRSHAQKVFGKLAAVQGGSQARGSAPGRRAEGDALTAGPRPGGPIGCSRAGLEAGAVPQISQWKTACKKGSEESVQSLEDTMLAMIRARMAKWKATWVGKGSQQENQPEAMEAVLGAAAAAAAAAASAVLAASDQDINDLVKAGKGVWPLLASVSGVATGSGQDSNGTQGTTAQPDGFSKLGEGDSKRSQDTSTGLHQSVRECPSQAFAPACTGAGVMLPPSKPELQEKQALDTLRLALGGLPGLPVGLPVEVPVSHNMRQPFSQVPCFPVAPISSEPEPRYGTRPEASHIKPSRPVPPRFKTFGQDRQAAQKLQQTSTSVVGSVDAAQERPGTLVADAALQSSRTTDPTSPSNLSNLVAAVSCLAAAQGGAFGAARDKAGTAPGLSPAAFLPPAPQLATHPGMQLGSQFDAERGPALLKPPGFGNAESGGQQQLSTPSLLQVLQAVAAVGTGSHPSGIQMAPVGVPVQPTQPLQPQASPQMGEMRDRQPVVPFAGMQGLANPLAELTGWIQLAAVAGNPSLRSAGGIPNAKVPASGQAVSSIAAAEANPPIPNADNLHSKYHSPSLASRAPTKEQTTPAATFASPTLSVPPLFQPALVTPATQPTQEPVQSQTVPAGLSCIQRAMKEEQLSVEGFQAAGMDRRHSSQLQSGDEHDMGPPVRKRGLSDAYKDKHSWKRRRHHHAKQTNSVGSGASSSMAQGGLCDQGDEVPWPNAIRHKEDGQGLTSMEPVDDAGQEPRLGQQSGSATQEGMCSPPEVLTDKERACCLPCPPSTVGDSSTEGQGSGSASQSGGSRGGYGSAVGSAEGSNERLECLDEKTGNQNVGASGEGHGVHFGTVQSNHTFGCTQYQGAAVPPIPVANWTKDSYLNPESSGRVLKAGLSEAPGQSGDTLFEFPTSAPPATNAASGPPTYALPSFAQAAACDAVAASLPVRMAGIQAAECEQAEKGAGLSSDRCQLPGEALEIDRGLDV